MLSSKFLKDIMTEAYPIIQRQLEDAKVIASFRELVTANGGDWSALKALMKAHVEDSLDESGDGKRVRKILDKADSSNAYAEMLGLANMNEKNFISGGDEQEEEHPDAIAALLSNTSLGLVRASSIQKSEQQAAPQPASDLTSSPGPQGQVAPIQPEAATSGEGASAPATGESPVIESAGDTGAQPAGGEDVNASDVPATHGDVDGAPDIASATGKPVEASASAAPAPKYAAPGEVTWETHPPEGVERSSVSMAFGNMGQDPVLIRHDLEKGTSQPIVKQGKVILDGWARFMMARNMVELDGQPMAYAVVQHDGSDPLIDAIRWNVEGRTLDDHQKKLIAANLTRQNPKRKDDIYRAFEIFLEPV